MAYEDYDFTGWATKNDIQCADGRVIRQNAFAADDGKKVPIVYMHNHKQLDAVLGHAILENRPEGVLAHGKFNDSPEGKGAKLRVQNGDIESLSIYANQLKQDGPNVMHGCIREVSLVLAGANPGAFITSFAHSDDPDEEFEATLYTGEPLELAHAASKMTREELDKQDEDENGAGSDEPASDTKEDNVADSEKTVQDVIDSMSEEQKNVLYYLVGKAAEGDTGDEEAEVKHNIFESDYEDNSMAQSIDFEELKRDAKRMGSWRDAAIEHGLGETDFGDVLQHDAATYGVDPIDYLFPDYRTTTNVPSFVSRDMTWVTTLMSGVSHTPFARIKSVFADITADEARAKGYTKGKKKLEEVFTLLKRTTDPQTVYKKQKFDRDDLIDITDFDVLAWVKGEMRMMLDEEIGRAVLIGDGRSSAAEDKIQETHIRPIWTDDDFYTIKAQVALTSDADEDTTAKAIIRAAIKARKDYKGSGNPIFFTTEDVLTNMLLLTDNMGRDLYDSPEKLAQKMRVSKIVTVEVMENQTRTTEADETAAGATVTLQGIIVNPKDYNIGADKGGAVSMFDDFDIDYNQNKYLIETRISGALVKPYSAIAIETYTKTA